MNRQGIKGRNHLPLGVMVVAAAALSLGRPASVTARNWNVNVVTGNWNVIGNWTPSGVPVAGDPVNIVFTDGVARTVTYNISAPSLGLLSIDLTGAGTTTTTLSMPSNFNLQANGILVGGYNGASQTNGRGALNQSAGTATTNSGWDFVAGYGAGSTGVYTLGGTGALVANQSEYIGLYGTGTFTQTAGSNTIATGSAFFDIGTYAGATGTYNLSGTGTLSANTWEYIGDIGTGAFNQTGGTNTISASGIDVGHQYGASGAYNLSGTGSLSADSEYVGDAGTGAFIQSGGTNSIGYNLTIGYNASGDGTYTLGAGDLSAGSTEYVGLSGSGAFNQTGGTNNTLFLEIAALVASSSGVYNLSGGAAVVGDSVFVGGFNVYPAGPGVLNVSGTGVLTVGGTLTLYNSPGTAINFSGGTINATALNFNGAPARFNWTGGTLNVTSNVTWDGAATGTTTSGAFGQGLTLATGQTLMVTGNETLGGAGTFNLKLGVGSANVVSGFLDNEASITLAGGTLTATGPITNNGTIGGYGIIGGAGGFTNSAQLTQGAGNLALANSGANSNLGNINLASGSQLQLTGSGMTNAGTLALNGGVVTGPGTLTNGPGGSLTGPGLISSPFDNPAGALVLNGGGTLNIVQPFTNAGAIEPTAFNANFVGGAITNSGLIQGLGSVGNAVTNQGSIVPVGGTLFLNGALTNSTSGLIRVATGNTLLVSQGLAANAGVVSLTGGTFDNNNHPVDNMGQISGYGTFASGGAGLNNHGRITFTGGVTTVNGSVTNEDGKTITVAYNPAIFTGLVTNNGAATFNIVSTTATFAGGSSGTFNGTFTNNLAAAFAKAGSGALEIDGPPTLNNSSSLAVIDTGTLRFKAITGSATIGTGVTATVNNSATLELAGSVSALGNGSSRVNIANNSSAAAGILVSGTHQQVGNIDGLGATQVSAGSDLTANRIIQSALVIGGTAGSPALVTIDASDASGNPLIDSPASLLSDSRSPGLIVADSLTSSGPFAADGLSSANLRSDGGANSSPVPEPSTFLLLLIALASAIGFKIAPRRSEAGDHR